jgi:hypothetical protein
VSVISTWEAVPNRLEQFWLYLVNAAPKGLPKSELAHLFSPPSLGMAQNDGDEEAGGNIFSAVLQESKALGLVELRETDGAIIPLLPPLEHKNTQHKIQWFRNRLRSLLTTPEKSNEKGQDDVPLALAWLALQSPLHPFFFGKSLSVEIESAFPGIKDAFKLNKTANLQQCYYWARYLGLCTFSVQQDRGDGRLTSMRIILPDPTVAIRSLLPIIFDGKTELTASEFLNRLGSICPVLERGEARKIILSKAAHPGDYPKDDELSEGTSLAMLRLEEQNTFSLGDHADALEPCMIIVGGHKKRFSHVRWEGGGHEVA